MNIEGVGWVCKEGYGWCYFVILPVSTSGCLFASVCPSASNEMMIVKMLY